MIHKIFSRIFEQIKRPSWRFTLVSSLCMLLVLGAMTTIYNVVVRQRIHSEAQRAIQEALRTDDDQDDFSTERVAILLHLTHDFKLPQEPEALYTAADKAIAYWYAQNPTGAQITYIDTSKLNFYAQYIPDTRSSDVVVAYVDVTGEQELISSINALFIFIILLGTSAAGAAAFYTGRQIERRELAVKSFYENMSHELKTPLASITGYGEGLQLGLMDDPSQIGKHIVQQTQKITQEINQILSLSRLESGTVQLKKERIYLDELIQDCLLPQEGSITARQLSLHLELARIEVWGDRYQLEHAFSNLIHNAIDHSSSHIAIQLTNHEVRISNDCMPLSQDELAHMFDRFYSSKTPGGTGIGLSLAQQIIELHGWHLTAKNDKNNVVFNISFCSIET